MTDRPTRHEELLAANADVVEAGWPRPTRVFERSEYDARSRQRNVVSTTRLPVPWINATEVVATGDWLSFRPDCHRAHEERLCAFCGLPIVATMLLGRYGDRGRETSGPGLHPRCMWMAARVCPHFTGRDGDRERDDATIVAWRYDGPGPGYAIDEFEDEVYVNTIEVDPSCTPVTLGQVRAMARADPLGDGTRTKTLARCPHGRGEQTDQADVPGTVTSGPRTCRQPGAEA